MQKLGWLCISFSFISCHNGNAQKKFEYKIGLSYFSWQIKTINASSKPANPYFSDISSSAASFVPSFALSYNLNSKFFLSSGFYLEPFQFNFSQDQFPQNQGVSGTVRNWFSYWNGEIPLLFGYNICSSPDQRNKLSISAGPSLYLSYVNGYGFNYNIIGGEGYPSTPDLPLIPHLLAGCRAEINFIHHFKKYGGLEFGISYSPALSTFTGVEYDVIVNNYTYPGYLKPSASALGLNLRFILGNEVKSNPG